MPIIGNCLILQTDRNDVELLSGDSMSTLCRKIVCHDSARQRHGWLDAPWERKFTLLMCRDASGCSNSDYYIKD
jgi:hypothetical protein